MNKCIIVYMESFIAYDPSTKTGELHAILTIDISLRSFLFYAAWQTMTHDKSLNLCTWMVLFYDAWQTMTHDKSLIWCTWMVMLNHETKPITMNHKTKTKTKTKTLKQPDYLTSSSFLRVPSKQDARSVSRRGSRRKRRRSRSRSSSSEPEMKSRKCSCSTPPEKKARARKRCRSVFVALGEFMNVDVGKNKSSIPTRTDVNDKLVTAMMKVKEKKACPNDPDTKARKIEPNENVDTPSSDPSNEQNKRRQRKPK